VKRVPFMTAALTAAAIAIYAIGGDPLVLERGAGGGGWRWLTAHFAHFDANHLLWDLGVFAVLGGWMESKSRTHLATLVVVSAAAISGAFWLLAPELSSYRGLSGIDAALSGATAMGMYRAAKAPSERWLPLLGMTALAAKITWEFWTGGTLFVTAESYVGVPLAHLVGAVVGFGLASMPVVGEREPASDW
jgi:rhomboid family GlyGly-CTERM serine protease